MAKAVKVGLRAGDGPPPGYLWSVWYLSAARDEAAEFLSPEQYAHVVDLLRALANERDPSHAVTVRVEAVEDFFELKDKGGVLQKINLRVFYTIEAARRTIVVLAALKKEADGQTPTWMKVRVRSRLRRLRNGEFGGFPPEHP